MRLVILKVEKNVCLKGYDIEIHVSLNSNL